MSKAGKSRSKGAARGTLSEEIGRRERACVLFYASWCPFSQSFLPIFEEYAKESPQECISVVIDEPGLCEEYAIEYYPTVLLFRKGKVEKRLDAEPGRGLNRKQLKEFIGRA